MSVVLEVAEDAYEGNARFIVSVDGVQIGGTQTATTIYGSGAWQTISLGDVLPPGIHAVTVTFLNPASGGTAASERALWVNTVSVGGATATVDTVLVSTTTSVTAAAVTPVTTPPTTTGVSLLGVNLSGAEDGDPVTGVYGYNYTYPTDSELDYFASLGMNVVRVPILWQRLQPVQDGPLSTTQLSYLDAIVAHSASLGMKIIIDPHDYGIAFGNDIGSAGTPNSSFANFWSQMATHFKNDPNVIFGLMNEPHDQTATAWAATAQAAVTAIRAAGATQEILVPGTEWDGGSSWISSGNAAALVNINDPDNNCAYEVHEYFDTAATGTSTYVLNPMIGPDRLAAVTQWAQENGTNLFLGEFGSGSDPTSLAALSNTVNYISANSNVWQGGTYWAGGPWLSNYMFSADPQNGQEAAQTAIVAAGIDTPIKVTLSSAQVTYTAGAGVTPFKGVVITDANIAQTETAAVTLSSAANGTVVDPNAGADGSAVANGVWTLSGSATAVAASLEGLVFTPKAAISAATTLTATIKDSASETASATSTVTPVAAPVVDTLALQMSEDSWNGDAEFTVKVNGQQVGGDYSTSVLHASGDAATFLLTGEWGSGVNDVQIAFINDAYGGSAARDRNLYVNSVAENGVTYARTAASLLSNGSDTFAVGGTTPAAAGPVDTLTLNLSEDAWQGNAEFKLYIDGVDVSTPQVVSALHTANSAQGFTFTGSFGAGSHTIGVQFVNDAYGRSASEDRNLYINDVTINGTNVFSGVKAQDNNGTSYFSFTTTH